jgi:hypothetical protein
VLETGLAVVHRGEEVMTARTAKQERGMQQPVTININAPIYGVNDLESAIDTAIRRSQMEYASYR